MANHNISSNLLISIIMPCKNAGLYLVDCLNSIIGQSYANWELIIVDDHSLDNSAKILTSYASKHANIKVSKNKNTGIISALRQAYSQSNGELVTRMDADDIMSPVKLEILHKQLVQHGESHVAAGLVKYFRDDQNLGNGYLNYANWLNRLSLSGNNYSEIYKECVIPSPCWMLYRKDLDRIGAFDSDRYPEDYDLVFRMYTHEICVIKATDEILHYWRDHSTRASRNDENYKDNNFISLKVDYFLAKDRNLEKRLILWGAGSKSKEIAKLLIAKGIMFDWITNNPKKIKHNIYGKILLSTDTIHDKKDLQLVIAVANPDDQKAIKESTLALGTKNRWDSFWFC